jgi:hypothetical protein
VRRERGRREVVKEESPGTSMAMAMEELYIRGREKGRREVVKEGRD